MGNVILDQREYLVAASVPIRGAVGREPSAAAVAIRLKWEILDRVTRLGRRQSVVPMVLKWSFHAFFPAAFFVARVLRSAVYGALLPKYRAKFFQDHRLFPAANVLILSSGGMIYPSFSWLSYTQVLE